MAEARSSINTDLVVQAMRSMEEQYKEENIFVQIHSANLSIHKVFLPDRHYAYHDQSGVLIKQWQGSSTVEDWLLDFHHRFLLGNTIGLNIAGVSGILAALLAVIGLRIWWPYRRFWKPKLRFSGKHSFARNSHSNLGVPLVLPLLLVTITGVILVYPTESRWLLQNGFSSKAPEPVVMEKAKVLKGLDEQIPYVHTVFPNSKLHWISTKQVSENGAQLSTGSERTIGLSQVGAWDATGKTSIKFAAQKIVIKDARQQLNKVRAINLSYALHIGEISFIYRLALILIGLSMCGLTFFAFRAFYLRRLGKK